MIKLECSNRTKVLLAFQTYMELCEVHILKKVDYHYSGELDLIYLTSEAEGKTTYYVPVSFEEKLTPAWIEKVLEVIRSQNSQPVFTLVIRERDSSAVHYTIGHGLLTLPSPEEVKNKKIEEEKKQYLLNELHKKKSEMYTKAKQLVA
ncbi:hypothetical protein AAG570_003068 [Ranatra chinensis]|uniref:tRNA-splicing endonuclease subunit Sen15 domain-containing protein n=1 Tax=Ranatra chinensis TaxID=642074 RepID=A0ABD0Y5S1_9HEMI